MIGDGSRIGLAVMPLVSTRYSSVSHRASRNLRRLTKTRCGRVSRA